KYRQKRLFPTTPSDRILGLTGKRLERGTMPRVLWLPIDLAHHDVERADDGRDVGDEASFAEFMRHREIAERTRTGAGSPGDGGTVADNVEAHLAARALSFQVGLAFGQLF